jgi:hypothetical protein
MRPRVALGIAALAAVGACAGHGTPARAPEPRPPTSVALVDSVAWETEAGEGVLHRIAVRTGSSIDTIPGVLTGSRPILVAGGVLGFAWAKDDITHAFRYDLATRRVQSLPLPRDFSPAFSAPAISPTGDYVAYVLVPGNSTAAGAVRRWPAGPEVVRSGFVAVPATDVALERARWLDGDRFEIYIDLTTAAERWQRIRGSVATRVIRIDTVARLP